MGYYKNATICLNGHVISSLNANDKKFCKNCGSATISNCTNCDNAIQGSYETTNIFGYTYYRPSYCHECGEPYPWTSKIIENAVELLTLDENLPNEQKEIIKLALPDLLVETPTTPIAIARYRKYIPSTQDFIKDGLKNLMVDVVSETVKKSLWG